MNRFWQKTKIVGDCLEWTAARDKTGYGSFKVNGKKINAHRFAFGLEYGKIPKGMLICHTCDNRKCVKIEHLFLGTYADNMQDCIKKGRFVFSKGSAAKPINHGNSGGYRRGCRCQNCKEAYKITRARHYLATGN